MIREPEDAWEWLKHYRACLNGEHGPVFMAEAILFLCWAPSPRSWRQWRDFIQELAKADQ